MSADSTALEAIERKVRAQLATQLDTVVTNFGAYLAAVIRGADAHTSITDLLSRADVHSALTAVLTGAQSRIETSIRAGYLAAARLAHSSIIDQFADLGADTDTPLPDASAYLDAVITDVEKAFAAALVDIHHTIAAGYDGITGPNAKSARILATNNALNRAARRLGVRVNAAAAVATHRGYTDTQLTLINRLAENATLMHVVKRWETTSTDPCPACAALHGTTARLDEDFDHNATTDTGARLPRVYRDLAGPPRHPNCRCRVVLNISDDTHTLARQMSATPPVPYTTLTAQDIRDMPAANYKALLAFLRASTSTVNTLLKRIRRGD